MSRKPEILGRLDPEAGALETLIPTMDPRVQQDLRQLFVEDGVTVLSVAAERQRLFGLLFQLIDGNGVPPTSKVYDEARKAAKAAGEVWPDRTALGKRFGKWEVVVAVAMRHMQQDARGVRNDNRSRRNAPGNEINKIAGPLKREDGLRALRTFHLEHGFWPSEREYSDWGVIKRRAARANDDPNPRIPASRHLSKWFGDFATALRAAQTEPARG